jgi:bacillithiol biosynthesis deacetylase BshB1
MKLDILAFGAHPDDVEISCSGTLLKHIALGQTVGVIDLTQGELGTRGNGTLRMQEAERSAAILGLSVRQNLGLRDGFFRVDEESLHAVISAIRHFRPDVVLANATTDRHPDHGRAGQLVAEACFLSGLPKVLTGRDGAQQEAWRPRLVLHYIQDYHQRPDVVMDITPHFERKLEALRAFSSQFFDPASTEPATPISGQDFFDFLRGRAKEMGRPIGAAYAEGFTASRHLGVERFDHLV